MCMAVVTDNNRIAKNMILIWYPDQDVSIPTWKNRNGSSQFIKTQDMG